MYVCNQRGPSASLIITDYTRGTEEAPKFDKQFLLRCPFLFEYFVMLFKYRFPREEIHVYYNVLWLMFVSYTRQLALVLNTTS